MALKTENPTSGVSAVSELAGLHLHRRRDVDGLRGVAILAVLGYHYFPDLIPGGYVGVDVFFVISGYVITNLLLRQQPFSRKSLAVFWGHRIRRLFPALIVVLAVTLGMGWLTLRPAQFDALGNATAWSAAMLGNIFAFRETGYFSAEPEWNPLLNLWSLGVEEQFYLVWPVAFAALWIIARGRLWLLGAFIAILGISSWIWAALYGDANLFADTVSAVFYLPWFRAWELLAGALIALLLLRPSRFLDPTLEDQSFLGSLFVRFVYWGSLLLLPFALLWPYESLRPTTYASAAVVLTALVIFLGPRITQADSVVGNRLFLGLGKISYPLYLWHWPLLAIALSVGLAETHIQRLGLVGISIVIATLTWVAVERPLQRRSVSTGLITFLVGAMVVVGVAGIFMSKLSMTRISVSDVAGQLAAIEADPNKSFGNEACFVVGGDGQDPAELAACIPPDGAPPGVLVWGDSHAASMIAGIEVALPLRQVSQLTIAGCEPSLPPDAPSDGCVVMDEIALEAIKEGKFTDVILAGWWRDEYDPQKLVRLIKYLEENADVNVVVVGPLPRWSPALPRVWSPTEIAEMERLPLYTTQGLMDQPFAFDPAFRQALDGLSVTYVSPLEVMCGEEGCRVSVDGTPSTLTSWDYGHLSKPGAEFLGRYITGSINQRVS